MGQETNVFTAVAEEGGDFVTIHFYQSMKAASRIKCSTVIFRVLVILPGQERGLTPVRPLHRLPPKPQPHCASAQHRLKLLIFLLVPHSRQVRELFLAVSVSVAPSHGVIDQHETPKNISFRRCKRHELFMTGYQKKKISSIANFSVSCVGADISALQVASFEELLLAKELTRRHIRFIKICTESNA